MWLKEEQQIRLMSCGRSAVVHMYCMNSRPRGSRRNKGHDDHAANGPSGREIVVPRCTGTRGGHRGRHDGLKTFFRMERDNRALRKTISTEKRSSVAG